MDGRVIDVNVDESLLLVQWAVQDYNSIDPCNSQDGIAANSGREGE